MNFFAKEEILKDINKKVKSNAQSQYENDMKIFIMEFQNKIDFHISKNKKYSYW